MSAASLPDSPRAFAEATWEDVAPHYEELARRLLDPADPAGVEAWLRDWSTLEELLSEAVTLASIAYTTDIRDPAKEAAHLRFSREIGPRMRQQRVRLMRRLVELGNRGYARDDLATVLRQFRTEIGHGSSQATFLLTVRAGWVGNASGAGAGVRP